MLMLSCSTTRSLQDNEYRLAKNTILVTNDKEFNTSDLTYYLKQQHKSWSPLLYVYNWTNGKGKGKGTAGPRPLGGKVARLGSLLRPRTYG